MSIRHSKLTPRQLEAFCAVLDSIERRGVPPTIVELSEAMGLSNKMASYAFLNSLEAKGYVKRIPDARRGLVVLKDVGGQILPREGEAA